MRDTPRLSYEERAEAAKNPAARELFRLMARKETNLAIACDVTNSADFLRIADELGGLISVFKTHIDTMNDFTPSVTKELLRLTKKHGFIIFEDRKLADIGNTVYLQYNGGMYKIADWANIVNAHIVPGPGIIEAVQKAIREKKDGLDRGLLLIAQMSSIGTLATGEYTRKAVEMANAYGDTIAGYIGTGSEPEELRKLSEMADSGHALLTPGVKIGASSDDLKQGYAPPEAAIAAGSDVIIVGRGIYEAKEPLKEAGLYRDAGWSAYRERIT